LKGFTLIEAMIAITILTFSLLGVVAMQSYFGTQTSDQSLKNCLLDGATNAMAQYRANSLTAPFNFTSQPCSFTCDIYTVSITLKESSSSGTTITAFPVSGDCKDSVTTASSMGKSFSVRSKVCYFP